MALEIRAKSNKTAEVLIYETIGDTWLGGINAKQFAEEIKSLGDMNTINVRINSDGGSVFDGVAMYNTLVKNKARIEVDVDGLAASIASIVAMSGDEIRMAKNAFMMIHDPWVIAAGTADELRAQADIMDNVRSTLLNTYGDRTGAKRSTISDMMREETWMDANQAYDLGFVDSITEGMPLAACAIRMQFKHTPEQFAERLPIPKPNIENIRQRLARNKQIVRRMNTA